MLEKLDQFSFNHSDQIDRLYEVMTTAQMKQLFDSRGEELRIKLNKLVDDLQAEIGASNIGMTPIAQLGSQNKVKDIINRIVEILKSTADGSSGADFISATSIIGLEGVTVQALLESLKKFIDDYKLELNSNSGASKIKTSNGNTVQQEINRVEGLANGAVTTSNQAKSIAETANNRVNNIMSNTPANKDAELVDMRFDALNNKTYATAGKRIDDITSSLAHIPNQTYITEKAKIIDVNNSLALKADQFDLDTTNSNVVGLQANKADISYVNTKTQGVSLAYKESFGTFSELQTAYPTGDVYNHAVLSDGYIYTYTNSSWISTQIQANGTGIADDSIDYTKLKTAEQDNLILLATNMAINGNFSNNSANWIGTTITGLTVANNEAIFSATAQNGALRNSFTNDSGKKYYAIMQVKTTSNLIRLEAGTNYKYHSGSGSYETLSVVFTGIGSTLYVGAKDTRSSAWDSISIKYLSIINLTDTFGVSHEPTIAQMDDMIAKLANLYIDGTKPIADKKWIVNNLNSKSDKLTTDAAIALKFDKTDVKFKRGWVILGTLDIDTTALTVTWNGTNAYIGHDIGLTAVTNKGVALTYSSNSEQKYIYVLNGVLTIGTANVTDGLLIGVLYNKKLYGAISNQFITIDGVTVGREWEPAIDDIAPNHDIIMPDNLYLANGIDLWTYTENILKNGYSLPEHYYLKSNRSNDVIINAGDYKRLILKGNGITSNATLSVVDSEDGVDISVTSKAVAVNSKAKSTGKTINTLVIGDSFIQYQYGDGILAYMRDFAIADGNSMVFKGTIQEGNTGLLCEGRGGWNEQDYLTLYIPTAERNLTAPFEDKLVSSPFVFSTDDTVTNKYFSFSEYMSINGITNVDNIVFCLGMNYGNGTGIRDMITAIKSDLPSVKIFVSLVPTAPSTYTTLQKGTRYNQNINYLNFCGNREAENIYIIPTHCNVHDKAGIQNGMRNVFQFTDLDTTTEFYNTGVHPTPLGAKSISYIIYNYLAYFA